jgi:hypothetical protein
MKTNPSRCVLAVEILAIILFHAVKIRQTQKQQTEIVYSHVSKNIPIQKSGVESKSGVEYMLVNLLK